MPEYEMDVSVGRGKYKVVAEKPGMRHFRCLRNGKEWRDLIGDNLVFELVTEIELLRNDLRFLLKDPGISEARRDYIEKRLADSM